MLLPRFSRREMLLYSSAVLSVRGGSPEGVHQHGPFLKTSEPGKLRYFRVEDAKDIEDLAALILPLDDSAGAREAGVVHFIDLALATFDHDKQGLYQTGLAQIRADLLTIAPERQHIAELTTDQQERLLAGMSSSEFFVALRIHTVMGFFGNESYGGNKDEAGWKLIGFEDRFAFQPPFGHYDAGQGRG